MFNGVFSKRPERGQVPAGLVIWVMPGSSKLASHESSHAPPSLRSPGLGHDNPIVGIADGAVVDRCQESVDLSLHPLWKAAISPNKVVMDGPPGFAMSEPSEARTRQRRIAGAGSLDCYPDSKSVSCRSDPQAALEAPQIDDRQGNCSIRLVGSPCMKP